MGKAFSANYQQKYIHVSAGIGFFEDKTFHIPRHFLQPLRFLFSPVLRLLISVLVFVLVCLFTLFILGFLFSIRALLFPSFSCSILFLFLLSFSTSSSSFSSTSSLFLSSLFSSLFLIFLLLRPPAQCSSLPPRPRPPHGC